MRRFHEAKVNNSPEVTIWGDGRAMREFLFVDDMAQASIFVLELDKKIYNSITRSILSQINIGTGLDISILELAQTIKNVIGYKGNIKFDSSKPNGTLRKVTDPSKLKKIGWTYKIGLSEGLEKTYKWYLNQSL
jgi:GDP-L-fucose synthase